MRIEKVDAVGGIIERMLDEKDHKVAEFYTAGGAQRFMAFNYLLEVAELYMDQKGACEGIEDEPCLYCMANAAIEKAEVK